MPETATSYIALTGGEIFGRKEITMEKEVERIRNWGEFLRTWNKNSKFEVLDGLLYWGPRIIFPMSPLTSLKAVKFYLEVAQWIDLETTADDPRYLLGCKAHQELIFDLIFRFCSSELLLIRYEEVGGLIDQYIDFLAKYRTAEHKRQALYFFQQEPYRRQFRQFLVNLLWSSEGQAAGIFGPLQERLVEKKQGIAAILVYAKMFDLILKEEVFKAIPALQEVILQNIFFAVPIEHLQEISKRFSAPVTSSGIVEFSWFRDQLNIVGSRGIQMASALAGGSFNEELTSLITLLIKQNAITIMMGSKEVFVSIG